MAAECLLFLNGYGSYAFETLDAFITNPHILISENMRIPNYLFAEIMTNLQDNIVCEVEDQGKH